MKGGEQVDRKELDFAVCCELRKELSINILALHPLQGSEKNLPSVIIRLSKGIQSSIATMSHIGALSKVHRYITGHDASGRSIFKTDLPEEMTQVGISRYSKEEKATGESIHPTIPATSSVPYTVGRLPANLANNADLEAYKKDLENVKTLPVPYVMPDGTALHYIELAPGTVTAMHQTISIDHDVMLEGEVELILDSGETRLLKAGDMIVQRGTMHAWRNASETKWARFFAAVQPIEQLEINGKKLELEFNAPPKL